MELSLAEHADEQALTEGHLGSYQLYDTYTIDAYQHPAGARIVISLKNWGTLTSTLISTVAHATQLIRNIIRDNEPVFDLFDIDPVHNNPTIERLKWALHHLCELPEQHTKKRTPVRCIEGC